MASGEIPLLAVMTTSLIPVPSTVPEMVAVPFPLSVKVIQPGNPEEERLEVGYPLVVTVKDSYTPKAKVVVSALVIAGASSTVRLKPWVASGETPLPAVTVSS